MDLTDQCIEQLRNIKLDLQIKLDAKKPSAAPPLPPPLPNLIQKETNTVNLKSIDGLTISGARTLLQHVTMKKRMVTMFDVEVSATVKYVIMRWTEISILYTWFKWMIWSDLIRRRRAEVDRIGRPSSSYWDSLYAPPAKRRKAELETKLESDFK